MRWLAAAVCEAAGGSVGRDGEACAIVFGGSLAAVRRRSWRRGIVAAISCIFLVAAACMTGWAAARDASYPAAGVARDNQTSLSAAVRTAAAITARAICGAAT